MVALAYHYLQPQFQGACAGVPVPQRVVLVNWAFVHLPLGLCLCQKCLFSLFPLLSGYESPMVGVRGFLAEWGEGTGWFEVCVSVGGGARQQLGEQTECRQAQVFLGKSGASGDRIIGVNHGKCAGLGRVTG